MDYAVRDLLSIPVTRTLEFEERFRKRAEILRGQPGFISTTVNRSLGYPELYATLTRFETREAWEAAVTSEENRAHAASAPDGLITRLRTQEAYEPVIEVISSLGTNTYLVIADWTLDNRPGNAAAFEASRKDLFELRQQYAPGFRANRLYRFLGNPTRYFVSQNYDSLEHLRAAGAAPEIQAFAQAHPASLYASTPPEVQYRRVVFTLRK